MLDHLEDRALLWEEEKEGPWDNEEQSDVIVVEYLDSFLMLYGYMGNADEGTPKYTKMTPWKHYNAPAIVLLG